MARNPLTAVPATRSSLPLLKIRRRLVVGVLSLSVASGIFSSVAWLGNHGDAPAAYQPPNQSAIALATTAVEDFLAARPSSVPAVSEVNNDFSKLDGSEEPRAALEATNLTFAGATPAQLGDGIDTPVLNTVQEKFTVSMDGRLYAITVPMVATGKDRWLLGAAPAITPERTAPNQTRDGIDYSSLYNSKDAQDGAQLPSSYVAQVKSWAETFAAAKTADRQLYLLTGDDTGRTYSGLGGWSLVEDPDVKTYVPVEKSAYGPTGYIVRVGLVLRSPASNGPTLSTDYDLYIRRDKSQQQPPVVAWGAAGSYKTLAQYQNADQS